MPSKKDETPLEDDFEWPDPSTMKPADAMRLADRFERELTEANRAAKLAQQRKATAKKIQLDVMDIYELDEVGVTMEDGSRVKYTPYPFDVYTIKNKEEFDAWAETQDESFYDTSPKLREQVFLDVVRRMDQDGEELPPGVVKFTQTRVSRTAITRKARPASQGMRDE